MRFKNIRSFRGMLLICVSKKYKKQKQQLRWITKIKLDWIATCNINEKIYRTVRI